MMTEIESPTSQEMESELSLRDELARQIESQNKQIEEESEPQIDDVEDQEVEDDEPAKKDSEDEEDTEEQEEITSVSAPEFWNKKDKELFNKLPDEFIDDEGNKIPVKDILLKYEKAQNKKYYQKSQDLASVRKEIQPLADLLTPYKGDFERLGTTPDKYISELIQVDTALAKDPAGTLKALISRFNVTPSDLGFSAESNEDDDDDYYTDSELKIKNENKALRREVDELKRLVTSKDNTKRSVDAPSNDVAIQVKEFEVATDEDGELLYPHFGSIDVKKEMAYYIDKGYDMEEAYKASPTVKKLIAEERKKDNESQFKREQIAKNKKASKRVKTSGVNNSDLKELSLNDELRARLSALRPN